MSRVSGSEGSNPSLPAVVTPMPMTFVMSARDELLAWAAGLYDGEGSSSMFVPRRRKAARRQIQVSQAGPPDEIPLVLLRFRDIVGEGNITGPYRGYLYYWKTTRKHAGRQGRDRALAVPRRREAPSIRGHESRGAMDAAACSADRSAKPDDRARLGSGPVRRRREHFRESQTDRSDLARTHDGATAVERVRSSSRAAPVR